jgi:hypothetical protein
MAEITGSTSSNPSKYRYYAVWSEYNINVAANTSDVSVAVYIQKISNYSATGSNNTHGLYINGAYFQATTSVSLTDSTPKLLVAGAITVAHNSDGSKAIGISCSGNLPTGSGFGPSSGSLSATVGLTTIPREAYVTNDVSFTVGNDIPISLSNPGNFFIRSQLYAGPLIKQTDHGQITSGTIVLGSTEDDAIYAQMPNALSMGITVRILTYSDAGYSSQVGSARDQGGAAYIDQNINKPTFTTYTLANVDKSIDVKDFYNNTLVTSSTATLLGSSSKFIKGYSKVRATITAANKMVPLNSATGNKYRFTNVSQSVDENFSTSDVTLDLDNVTANSFTVTAFDSRNLTTAVGNTMTYMADYAPTTVYNMSLARDNSVDSGTTLAFEADFFKEYFGGGTSGVLNTLTIEYRYKETTDTWGAQTWDALSFTSDGDGYVNFSDYIDGDLGNDGFDTNKSFDIQVRAYDKLTAIIVEDTLSVGTPLMDLTAPGISILDKYDTAEGGDLQVYGRAIHRFAGMQDMGLTNANFEIWQDGSGPYVNTGVNDYCADQWKCYTGGSTSFASYTRQAVSDLPGSRFVCRMQRSSGQTSTIPLFLGNAHETADSIPYQGQPVSIRFSAKAGANFSASGGQLDVILTTGTGADQNIITGFTGQVQVTESINATTTRDFYEVTFDPVGSSITQIGVLFKYTPTGTAGANDWIEIGQVSMTPTPKPMPLLYVPVLYDFLRCLRYYWYLEKFDMNAYDAGGSQAGAMLHYKVPMRTTPTFTPSVALASNCSGVFVNQIGIHSAQVYTNVTSTGHLTLSTSLKVDARM